MSMMHFGHAATKPSFRLHVSDVPVYVANQQTNGLSTYECVRVCFFRGEGLGQNNLTIFKQNLVRVSCAPVAA